MVLQVLDPTNETAPPVGKRAPRPASLAGKTVGFISNGKEGTTGFFAHLDRMLREDLGVAEVIPAREIQLQCSGRSGPRGRAAPLASRRHRDRRLRQLLIVQFA
jgi:hypothetical protein